MEHNKAFVEAIVNRMKTVLGVESDTDVAKLLGGSRSMLSLWKNRGKIPFQQCIDMAAKHNISLDWLIMGRGAMELATDDPGVSGSAQYVEVPQYDAATMLTMERFQAWSLPRSWMAEWGLDEAETMIVRAAGDAMSPAINDGQLVIVDSRVKDVDGIYLVRSGNSVRFRRLQRMIDGSVRLMCDNPAYAAETIAASDVPSLHLAGYCHAVIALLR